MLNDNQKRYLGVELLPVATLINMVINFGFGYLGFGSQQAVSLWGVKGLAFDLFLTTFLLALIMSAITLKFISINVRNGRLDVLPRARQPDWLARWPLGLGSSAATLAVLATPLLAPMSLGWIALFGVSGYAPAVAIAIKTIYSGVLSLVLAYPILLIGVREQRFAFDAEAVTSTG